MKIHSILFLSLMLPAWTLSACGTGTLKCESSDVPTVCDFTQNYQLSGEACEVKKVDGCEIASFDTSTKPCFLCEKGKVLDGNSELCVNVETDKVVENCFRYEKTSSDCTECNTDYFLDGGKCLAVGNIKVNNCAVYSTITQCKTCDSGYYLVGNECVKIETVTNCRSQTSRKCTVCASGYFLNMAYNSNPFTANVQTFELFASGKYSETSINLGSNATSVCEKITVFNCSELETAHTCKTCDTDFFVTSSKLCQRYPESPIANCIKYSAQNKCTECAPTFFVKINSGADECLTIPTVENCETYNNLNGFCSACLTGFWLNESLNSCVARVFNPPANCLTIDPKADLCSTCNVGATKVTNGTGCYVDIANCANQRTATNMDAEAHICIECDITHYLVGQACQLRTVTGCSTYLSQKNACDVCKSTHYISDAKDTCTIKSIPDCVIYTNDDSHTCLECVSLKFPDSASSICSPITKLSECYWSDGRTDACAQCNTNIIKTAGGDCVGARTSANADPNCVANVSATDDGSCDRCADGFLKADFIDSPRTVAKTQAEMDALFCLKIDTNGTSCVWCKDGYQLTAGVCNIDPNSASLCLRMVVNSTNTLLAHSGECYACKPNMGLVLTGGNCAVSTEMASFLDCDILATSSSTCTKCTAGSHPVATEVPVCVVETFSPSHFTSNPSNCAMRLGFDKCAVCNEDNLIDGGNTTCSPIAGGSILVKNTFDVAMNQMGSQSVTTIVECAQYTQITDTIIKCTQCNANFVGIIDTASKSSRLAGLRSGNEAYNVFSECVAKADMYKTATSVDHVTADDCLIGMRKTGETSGYGCLRCVAGKIGVWVTVTKLQNGTDFTGSSSMIVVGSCGDDTSTNMTNPYIGTSFMDQKTANINLPSNWMSHTKCSTAGHVVFYMVQWALDTPFLPFISTDGSAANKTAYCGAEADVLDDLTQKVDNCAIYTFGATGLATFIQGTTKIPTVNCQSCKPGFYVSTSSSTGGITSCQEIHGCNTDGVRVSDENSWLNGCSNPDSGGWKASFTNNVYEVSYFDPMPNSSAYKIDNCLLLSQGEEKCIVCKPGFMALGNSCGVVNSTNSRCTTPGMGYTDLHATISSINTDALKMFRYLNFAHIRSLHSGAASYASMTNSFCHACDSGAVLMKEAVTSDVCAKKLNNNPLFENCAEFSNSSCTMCSTGYVIDTDQGSLCKLSSRANCISMDSAQCLVCKTGFKLINNDCVEQFCAEFEGEKCVVCNSGYMMKDYEYTCMPNPDSNDDCDAYSPMLNGVCVKCKTAGQIPYHITYTNSSNQKSKYNLCKAVNTSSGGWLNMNFHLPYVKITANSSSVYTAAITQVQTTARQNREYTSSVVGSPPLQVCVPENIVSNCGIYVQNDEQKKIREKKHVCTKCNSDFTLTYKNKCLSTLIPNCATYYEGMYKCNACADSHYLATDKLSCVARAVSVNCADVEPLSDTCSSCTAKEFYKNSVNVCVPYTAEHCKVKHDTLNICAECVDNAWMDKKGTSTQDDDVCVLAEDPNCVAMKTFENECQLCVTGFYLKTTGLTQTCTVITAANCSTNKTHVDECATCAVKHYYDGTTCTPNTEVEFCTTYSPTLDECSVCTEGYYPLSGTPECRKYPTGLANCATYSAETTCLTCDSNYHLVENVCTLIPSADRVANCLVHDSATTCSECIPGKFMTSKFRCDTYDAVVDGMCEVYESHERCKSCIANHILNEETKLCEPSGISNCMTATRGSPNLCEVCNSGFFTSSNKQTCMSPSPVITNCQDYETQTKCKKCNSNFLLSLNGSACDAIGTKAGANCLLGMETAKPECDICEFGFMKNEIGECVKITETFCAYMSGEKCGLCLPKMKMTKEGKCENPNVVPEPTSVAVFKAFAYLLVMLAMMM